MRCQHWLFIEAHEIALRNTHTRQALTLEISLQGKPVQIAHCASISTDDLYPSDVLTAESYEFEFPPLPVTGL